MGGWEGGGVGGPRASSLNLRGFSQDLQGRVGREGLAAYARDGVVVEPDLFDACTRRKDDVGDGFQEVIVEDDAPGIESQGNCELLIVLATTGGHSVSCQC